LTGIPRLGLGAVSIGYIALFLGVAIPRVRYPFGLEWLEGQALVSVQRILEGQPLFTAPSWEYIPFMYTPLYYYVSAAWVGVMDLGLPALRVVSLVATLVCFVLSFAIARRASGDSSTGLIAAGLFAATFEASGAWFDLARVDMLFLALLLSGLYAVQRNGRFSLALAAPLLAAAYLTKQTALVMVLPILLYAVLVRPRAGLLLAGALAAIVLATTLVWDRASDGWYWRFTLELPRQTYTLAPAQALGFWTHDLLGSVPIALLAIAFHLGTRWRSVWSERCRSGRRLVDDDSSRQLLFVTLLATGLIGGAWASRAHAGGFANVLIPAYCAIAIVGSVALHEILASGWGTHGRIAVVLLAFVQFGILAYDPRALVPSPASARSGHALAERLASYPGDVYTPFHPEVALLAGKRTFAQAGAWSWLIWSDDQALKDRVNVPLHRAFREQRFDAVVCAQGWCKRFEALQEGYAVRGPALDDVGPFWQRTGKPIRPAALLTPRAAPD
jgi:4-amino-4-deoxy-L-arabinose transferase-like glycosyltransferase